jgi:hypothetical protein
MAADGTTSLASASGPVMYPPVRVPELSRRTFLRLLGVVVAGTALEFSPLSVIVASLMRNQAVRPYPQFSMAIGSLLRQAIEEVRSQGFPIDLEQASVVTLHERP